MSRRVAIARIVGAAAPIALVACNVLLGVGELRYERDDAATPDASVADAIVDTSPDSDAGVDATIDSPSACDPKWTSATPVFGAPQLVYQSSRGLARIALDGDAMYFGVLDDDSIPDHAKIVRTNRVGQDENDVAFGVDVAPGVFARGGSLYFATDDARIGVATDCRPPTACPVVFRDPDFGSLAPLGRPFAVAADGTLFVPLRDGRLKRLPPPLPGGDVPDPELMPEIPDAALSMLSTSFPPGAAPSAAVDETHVYLGSGLANLGVYSWSLSALDASPQQIHAPSPGDPEDAARQGSLVTACRTAYMIAHPSAGEDLYQLRGSSAERLLTAQDNGPATLGVVVVGARYVYLAGFFSMPEATGRILQFDRAQTSGATLVRVNGVPPAWFEATPESDAAPPRGFVTGLALDDDYLYVVVNAHQSPPSNGRIYRIPKL